MKSVVQSQVEGGGGTIKTYANGMVGYQRDGQSHDSYKAAMKSMLKINPANNNLLSKHFGPR